MLTLKVLLKTAKMFSPWEPRRQTLEHSLESMLVVFLTTGLFYLGNCESFKWLYFSFTISYLKAKNWIHDLSLDNI